MQEFLNHCFRILAYDDLTYDYDDTFTKYDIEQYPVRKYNRPDNQSLELPALIISVHVLVHFSIFDHLQYIMIMSIEFPSTHSFTTRKSHTIFCSYNFVNLANNPNSEKPARMISPLFFSLSFPPPFRALSKTSPGKEEENGTSASKKNPLSPFLLPVQR